MKAEHHETLALFKPEDLPADAVGRDVDCYVSAMVAKTAFEPHPVMVALRDLGVAHTTIAAATNKSKSYFTHIAAGRRPLPDAMLPHMLEILAQSVSAARAAVGKAMDNPEFPAAAIEHYMKQITKAVQVLKENRM